VKKINKKINGFIKYCLKFSVVQLKERKKEKIRMIYIGLWYSYISRTLIYWTSKIIEKLMSKKKIPAKRILKTRFLVFMRLLKTRKYTRIIKRIPNTITISPNLPASPVLVIAGNVGNRKANRIKSPENFL